MNKEKLVEVFNELLGEWEGAEGTVIHDRGCIDDYPDLEKRREEYKQKFFRALDEV
ncbi:hypothetical protein NKR74_14775 [Bacillus sp. 3103sda1]|uniref:hypothetical protein n=1 Tax=Bacillus sp. 3103sda1 TaxID=2953808 RepID=UPI00209EF5EB|nr:hypothetical protein [Bacillus sp. 3103sda1]MCP1124552.1 hypothetical protein [Bacillus sp. 3103sda1]